jgi:hypothetical protein
MYSELIPFIEWLRNTPLSLAIQTIAWVIPLVQTIHIVCIAAVMGSVAMFDLRLLGTGIASQSVSGSAHRFLPWTWGALVVLLLTGAVLIIGEPARTLVNPVFLAKMTMLIIVVTLTLTVQSRLHRAGDYWESSPSRRSAARAIGAASLLLWVAIIFAGRWIAYV